MSSSEGLSFSEESEESSEEYFPPQEDGRPCLQLYNKDDPKIKFFQPSFWNGVRWKECTNNSMDTGLSAKLISREITVLSWNVWFGTRKRPQRMKALGKVVVRENPDFIFFQEIDSDLMREISSSDWSKNYYVSDPHAQRVSRYGNCMFSRYKMRECAIKESSVSQMGRKMMLGTCVVQKSPQLTFGTFHLESDAHNAPERAAQVKDFLVATEHCSCTFVVGDTNLVSDTEEAVGLFQSKFRDAWPTLHPGQEGFTFDTQTNTMGRSEYLSRGIVDHKRKRLDRLFYTPETLQPFHMEIMGTKPYKEGEFISDHYGIFVKLRLL